MTAISDFRRLIVRYQRAASIPLLMSIDAEWGLAMQGRENTISLCNYLGALPESESNLVYELGETNRLRPKIEGLVTLAPLADI
jgi:hypothetical protein